MNNNFCPNCGAQLTSMGTGTQTFCHACGTRISKNTESFNMKSAYKSMFKNYAKFNGRSRRSEYWYAYLANMLIIIIAFFCFVPAILDINNYGEPTTLSGILMGISVLFIVIYSFVLIVPLLSLSVRRLHDTGKSGWYLLLGLIPYVGSIIIIVFMAQDTQKGLNQYGPDPKSTLE